MIVLDVSAQFKKKMQVILQIPFRKAPCEVTRAESRSREAEIPSLTKNSHRWEQKAASYIETSKEHGLREEHPARTGSEDRV